MLQVLCHLKKQCNVDKEGKLEADTAALFMSLLYSLDLDQPNENSLMMDTTFTKNFHLVGYLAKDWTKTPLIIRLFLLS